MTMNLADKLRDKRQKDRAAVLRESCRSNGCAPPPQRALDALERCFERARGCSGGQRRVRQFLFAWQHTNDLGGWDPTDLWSLDEDYRGDLLTVLVEIIAKGPGGWYPYLYGFGPEMDALRAEYGPKGREISDYCHKCGTDVRHHCDQEGYEARQREDAREREYERIREEKPYGSCPKCGFTIMSAGATTCDVCAP